MDWANFGLARHLAARGHEVHIVAHRIDDELRAHPGVHFHRAPRPLNSDFLGEPFLHSIGRRWAKRIAARGGRVVVNGGNCSWGDANWVHYVHAAYRRQADGSALRRLRLRMAHRRAVAWERRAIGAARVVIANSSATANELVRLLNVPPDKIHVIYCGIDPQRFRPVADAAERDTLRRRFGWRGSVPVALFVGAMGDRRKGFDALFDAWRRLAAAGGGWDTRLAVVGYGAERELWERRVRECGLARQISFLGFRSDVPELMRAADLLVAPARYEPYGLGVQEALCCGIPAMVSACAGIAERYPRELKHLLIENPDDIDEIVGLLAHWREHQAETKTAVAPFGDTLRRFTWDDMGAEILRAIEGSEAKAASVTGMERAA
jgi:glycosyltransferase involved in cell wall biosynthesis